MNNRERTLNILYFKPGIVSIPSEDDYLLKDREAFETLFKPKMQFTPDRVNTEYFRHFNETRPKTFPWAFGLEA